MRTAKLTGDVTGRARLGLAGEPATAMLASQAARICYARVWEEFALARHFLRAGALVEGIAELREQAAYLRTLLQLSDQQRTALILRYEQEGYYTTFVQEVEKTLDAVVRGADELSRVIGEMPCEPLIYTGEGTTDEVIEMLDSLIDSQRAGVRANST